MEETELLDIVDEALEQILDEVIPDDADEEEFDDLADLFMSVYADLVDDGIIPEAPDETMDEQLKKDWVESSIPILREKLKEVMDGYTDLE